jgi:hypothetical protein
MTTALAIWLITLVLFLTHQIEGVPGGALQRHHLAVADEVDMGVDQPRKHGRIAVIDQLTIGGRLIPHRLNPDNATVLEKHSGTTSPEIFTIEGMVCPDREHTAWLPNRPAPVNAHPCKAPA